MKGFAMIPQAQIVKKLGFSPVDQKKLCGFLGIAYDPRKEYSQAEVNSLAHVREQMNQQGVKSVDEFIQAAKQAPHGKSEPQASPGVDPFTPTENQGTVNQLAQSVKDKAERLAQEEFAQIEVYRRMRRTQLIISGGVEQLDPDLRQQVESVEQLCEQVENTAWQNRRNFFTLQGSSAPVHQLMQQVRAALPGSSGN
jgi:hypothetical protein